MKFSGYACFILQAFKDAAFLNGRVKTVRVSERKAWPNKFRHSADAYSVSSSSNEFLLSAPWRQPHR
jgi:hypothetical protein